MPTTLAPKIDPTAIINDAIDRYRATVPNGWIGCNLTLEAWQDFDGPTRKAISKRLDALGIELGDGSYGNPPEANRFVHFVGNCTYGIELECKPTPVAPPAPTPAWLQNKPPKTIQSDADGLLAWSIERSSYPARPGMPSMAMNNAECTWQTINERGRKIINRRLESLGYPLAFPDGTECGRFCRFMADCLYGLPVRFPLA